MTILIATSVVKLPRRVFLQELLILVCAIYWCLNLCFIVYGTLKLWDIEATWLKCMYRKEGSVEA